MSTPRASGRRRAALVALAAALALALPASADGAATIYFRGASTAQTGSGASTLTLSAPSNTAVGDIMIIDVDAVGSTSFSAPSGWTSIFAGTNDYNGSAFQAYSIVAYRVATAADIGATYTVSLGSSRKAEGRLASYVGVDNTSPVETSATGGGVSNGTSITYPSITTTAANTMVVIGAGVFNSSGTFTITAPTGTKDRANVKTSGTGSVEGGDNADFVQAAAGATGTKTGTISASSAWGAATIGLKPAASGALQFATAPSSPSPLASLTLNGQAQTLHAQMNNFAVDDTTGTGSGWHVQVNGNSASGFSPVFAQYCPAGSGTCSGTSDPPGYVTSGQNLSSGSLTLNTTGASWSTTGGTGSAPTFSCSSGCTMDTTTATTIASAASGGAGEGPWSTSGFGSTSLSLAAPTTTRTIPSSEEYRVDLVWTLSSGP